MPHLDEGHLMALLDGELAALEEQETHAHLAACPECRARLQELRGFMVEADGLVGGITVPPAASAPAAPVAAGSRRRLSPRTLAWAATVVAATGLGFAGSNLLRSPATEPAHQVSEANRSAASAPPAPATQSPAAAAPPLAPPEQELAVRQVPARRQDESASTSGLAVAETDEAADRVAGQRAGVQANQTPVVGRIGEPDTRPLSLAPSEPQAFSAKSAERSRAEAPSLTARDQATVTMEEAVRSLSGVIRLIDGLTPEQFEVTANDSITPSVRVTYRVGPGETPLILEQSRGVRRTPDDAVSAGAAMAPVQSPNQLEWKDLDGFSLRLIGNVSKDSLKLFKARVK